MELTLSKGGERGAATTLRGVNAGLPSINLSAKFFISPLKKHTKQQHMEHGMLQLTGGRER